VNPIGIAAEIASSDEIPALVPVIGVYVPVVAVKE
jgi:hypothetical protein